MTWRIGWAETEELSGRRDRYVGVVSGSHLELLHDELEGRIGVPVLHVHRHGTTRAVLKKEQQRQGQHTG